MAVLDSEVKKLELRNSPTAQARVKELRRDLKKKEGEAGRIAARLEAEPLGDSAR